MATTTLVAEQQLTEIEPRSTSQRGLIRSPCVVVALATVAIGVIGLRGADYPAHFARALLWERAGASVWNNLWYAGHSTPTYSVLAPPVMALIGPFGAAAVGSIVATYCFTRLTADLLRTPTTSLANHVFALAMLVNVVVGRAPFALGLACALVAVLTWHRDRIVVTLVAAVLTPLVSPVAAAFLAIAAAAVAVTTLRRAGGVSGTDRTSTWRAVAIAVASCAPVAITTVLFGESGRFPFRAGNFIASVIILAIVAIAVSGRVVRAGAALATVAAVVVFLVPNPLGGNFVRLGQIAAVPLAVTALPSVSRALRAPFVLLLVTGLGWSLLPGAAAAVDWWGDESLDAGYHQPLVEQVRARNRDGRPIGRVEVPFTENHWESFFVATEVPFARGWERQVDLDRNEPLYDEHLTVERYREWLLANGVRWIAVADVALDRAGAVEARLLAGAWLREIPWLHPVWSNDDWRLYEVDDYVPIVDLPARLVEQGTDSLVVRTPHAATVTVRYRYTPHLTISGSACVEQDEGGWIVAHLPAGGEYRLAVDPATAWLRTASHECP